MNDILQFEKNEVDVINKLAIEFIEIYTASRRKAQEDIRKLKSRILWIDIFLCVSIVYIILIVSLLILILTKTVS
jgi:hypothetical protein